MSLADGPIAPFDAAGGVWLRCAFHVHTTESDGWLTPEVQRRYHAWAGYDVLAITDHDRLTPAPPGADDLLVVGGTEISLTAPHSRGPLHVLGIGVTGMPEVGREATLTEAAAAIGAGGGLAFVAHPVWSGLRTDELTDFAGVTGIEVFNASCDVEQDRGEAGAHWDVWLAAGHRLTGIATDDTHYPGYDAFRAWTMVQAAERSREALLAALAAGRCYATTGPRILDLRREGGGLIVRTTPARAIAVLANPPFGAMVSAGHHTLAYRGRRQQTADGQTLEGLIEGELLTGAVFGGHPAVGYARVVVIDERGRRAWSSPVWVG